MIWALFRVRISVSDAKVQVEVLDVLAKSAEQEIIAENYRRSQEVIVQEQHACVPQRNDRHRLPGYPGPIAVGPSGCLLLLPK